MSRGDDGFNLPLQMMGYRRFSELAIEVVSEAVSKKSHGRSTIERQVWAVAKTKSVFWITTRRNIIY